MMHGGDLYELAKILGHSNIKMTERYAKLGKNHIARTGGRRRVECGDLMAEEKGAGTDGLACCKMFPYLFPQVMFSLFLV